MYYWLKDLKTQYQGACNGKISESQLFIFVQMRSGVEFQVKINQECFNISANLKLLWFLAVLSFRMCSASWRKKMFFLMESVICVQEQLFFFLFNIFAALKRQSCNSNAICGWKHELCSQAQRRRLLIVVFLSSRCGFLLCVFFLFLSACVLCVLHTMQFRLMSCLCVSPPQASLPLPPLRREVWGLEASRDF